MYLIVRGLDNLKEGYKQRMIAWRHKGMNGTLEERDQFIKQLFFAARFNGRFAIMAAPALKKSQREVLDVLKSKVMREVEKQADETDYDADQKNIYLEAHRKAYESLAEEFGLN